MPRKNKNAKDTTKFVSPKEAARFYKVSEQTLRTWASNGKIDFIKTSGGHRRYKISIQSDGRQSIIYARVSSHKQKEDLKRQAAILKEKYPNHRLIKDVGSGINVERKGFKTILELLFDGHIKEVVVTYSDRFTRFSYELFEWIFQRFGAKLVALNDSKTKSDEQELAEDLIAITTVFSSRFNGKRGSKVRKKN